MTKYVFMKLIGLLLVIVGFSYCLTSFSNFYAYLFGDIEIANGNVYVMASGLIFPLHMFIFGIFFYFYTDKQFAYINPSILISGICFIVVGIIRLIISNGIMQFIHISYGFMGISLGLLLVYGCIRFKY